MEGKKNTILVPFDFSEKAEYSLIYALQIAEIIRSDVYLIHFLEETGLFAGKTKTQKIEEEEYLKHTEQISNLQTKYNYQFQCFFRSGKIKNILKSTVDEINTKLIISPVLFNSHGVNVTALEIIDNAKDCNIPVIVIKQPPLNKHIREIVVPVEFDKKYKEELRWVIYLAKYFKCNVNLVRPHFNDPLIKRYVDNNVFFSKKLLDVNNIIYGLKISGEESHFKDVIFDFAHSIDADLIIIMYHKFKEYALNKNNAIDESETIPIMCVNERADLRNYQGFF